MPGYQACTGIIGGVEPLSRLPCRKGGSPRGCLAVARDLEFLIPLYAAVATYGRDPFEFN